MNPVGLLAHRRHDGITPASSDGVGTVRVMPRPANRSAILPIAIDRHTRRRQAVEQRRLRRRHRVVVPVRRPRVRAGRPDKRPRDHAADSQAVHDDAIGRLAHPVQLGHGHDVFMRGNLEDAVGGGVHDGPARGDMRVAEPLDDLGARRDLVAQGLPANLALEPLDHVWRKAVGKRRERPVEHDAGDLPVAGHRVLAGRGFGHPAERRAAAPARRHAPKRTDVAKPERLQVRARADSPAGRCCRACRCPRRRSWPHRAVRRCRRCRGRRG